MNMFQSELSRISLSQLKYEGVTLGEGSFGVVRLAKHRVTRRKYAVKVLKHDHATSQEEREALDNETGILEQMDHRFVVKTWHVKRLPKATYLVMDYCSRGSLLDYINSFTVTVHQFRRYAAQMVSGLMYVHDRDICHRDIKLENYVLDARRDVKLIDFGLSKVTRLRQRDRVGTPAYAAPQVCQHDYDPFKADVWALGVVMFCMVHGERPYDSDDFDEILLMHRDPMKKPLVAAGHYDVDRILFNTLRVDEDARWGLDELSEVEWLHPIPCLSPSRKNKIELSRMRRKKKVMAEQRKPVLRSRSQRKIEKTKVSENVPYMEITKQKEKTKSKVVEKFKVKEPCSSTFVVKKNNKEKQNREKEEKCYKDYNKEQKNVNYNHLLRIKDKGQSAHALDQNNRVMTKPRRNKLKTKKQLDNFFETSENKGEFFVVIEASKKDVHEKCSQALTANFVDCNRVRDCYRCSKNFGTCHVTFLMSVRVDFATSDKVTVKFVKKDGSDEHFAIISKKICREFFSAARRPQSCVL